MLRRGQDRHSPELPDGLRRAHCHPHCSSVCVCVCVRACERERNIRFKMVVGLSGDKLGSLLQEGVAVLADPLWSVVPLHTREVRGAPRTHHPTTPPTVMATIELQRSTHTHGMVSLSLNLSLSPPLSIYLSLSLPLLVDLCIYFLHTTYLRILQRPTRTTLSASSPSQSRHRGRAYSEPQWHQVPTSPWAEEWAEARNCGRSQCDRPGWG